MEDSPEEISTEQTKYPDNKNKMDSTDKVDSIDNARHTDSQKMDMHDFLADDLTCTECNEEQQCKFYGWIPELRVQKIVELLHISPGDNKASKSQGSWNKQ